MKKAVIDTINGPQTIEGLTVGEAKAMLAQAPDDAVCVFMFEMTPTVRAQMAAVDLMVMPTHAVFGSSRSEVCVFVGPEIENAKFEKHYQNTPKPKPPQPPPVDRSNTTTTNGQPLEQRPETDSPDGQHANYLVLTPEEREKGFVRPVRDAYIHEVCGKVTTMGRALSETYARDPKFYGATYCCFCKGHFPVGEKGEFYWYPSDDGKSTYGPKVGT